MRATVGSDEEVRDDEHASSAILEAIAKSLFPARYRGIRPSTAAVVAVSRSRSFRRLQRNRISPKRRRYPTTTKFSGCRALLPKPAQRRMTKPKGCGDDGGVVPVCLCVVYRTSRDSPVAEVPCSRAFAHELWKVCFVH